MRAVPLAALLPATLLLVTIAAMPRAMGLPAQQAPTSRPEGQNNEADPVKQRVFDQRRAQAIEARHVARQLLVLGRQGKNPLPLIAAAQLFQQAPSPRPLSPSTLTASKTGTAASAPTVLDAPEPGDLLAEARALVQTQGGPLRPQLLALLDQIARVEVVVRGALLGPQQSCEGLSNGVKLTYNILYEGGERAVLGVSGEGPGSLHINISDDQGALIARAPDRSLVSWYPRWRGVFRIEITNRTAGPIHFCIETN